MLTGSIYLEYITRIWNTVNSNNQTIAKINETTARNIKLMHKWKQAESFINESSRGFSRGDWMKVWKFRKSSDLSGLDQNSPPWLAVKIPLKCLLGWLTYIFYCAFIVYLFCILTCFSFLPFVQSNLLFKCLFHLSFSPTVLFNHC